MKYIYKCKNCSECVYKDICTKSKGNKQLHVATDFIKLREQFLNNATTEKGILLRMNKLIQVEGAFGVIKQDCSFRKFLMREKTKIELLIISFEYNINKFHNKTLQKRNIELFHKQQIS